MEYVGLQEIIDLFPIPMEVFSTDGVCIYANTALLEFFNISNSSTAIGNYNILLDPFINNKLGLSDYIKRVFSGEIISIYNVRVPFEEIYKRYNCQESNDKEQVMYQDITNFPLLHEDGTVAYIVSVIMIKRIYQLRLDIIKARDYIDRNWLDEYNIEKIAQYSGLGRHHLVRLFKSLIGMTPLKYYQNVKIEKIKEALENTDMSISEVFSSCGVDYSGVYADTFKKHTGMTPMKYRKSFEIDINNSKKNTVHIKSKPDVNMLSDYELEERLFHIAEHFPIPIQIFRRNGDIVYINEAVLKMWNVKDTSMIIGKYNLIQDPFANSQPELKEGIKRVFRGEVVLIPDVKIPLETFWDWYKTRSTIYDIEAVYTDILNFPVKGVDNQMAFMVSIFFTSRIYQGNSVVAKTKEYIDSNWRDEYNIESIARASGISHSHVVRQFKKYTAITPYEYYHEIKISKLKEALQNNDLSIAQAFLFCGFRYPGNYARFFKDKVGMTPSQYRNTINVTALKDNDNI